MNKDIALAVQTIKFVAKKSLNRSERNIVNKNVSILVSSADRVTNEIADIKDKEINLLKKKLHLEKLDSKNALRLFLDTEQKLQESIGTECELDYMLNDVAIDDYKFLNIDTYLNGFNYSRSIRDKVRVVRRASEYDYIRVVNVTHKDTFTVFEFNDGVLHYRYDDYLCDNEFCFGHNNEVRYVFDCHICTPGKGYTTRLNVIGSDDTENQDLKIEMSRDKYFAYMDKVRKAVS